MTWETVIGLEVHVQLRTKSKMFCGCRNQFGAKPNTLVCPVCLGLPGALPVLNRQVVEYALKLGVALGSDIQTHSQFARKNYFYPDLPKNYQISQYSLPILRGGTMDIGTREAPRIVPIERAHLEEDAGKSLHPEGDDGPQKTRIDFNRAGVPLLEMVTDPELKTASEAHVFLTRFRQIARVLKITDGDMEKGSLRCDANISLRRPGDRELGVKTEIKNLNSIRGVERALEAETRRQTEILDSGGRVEQCTLLYDADNDRLAIMRSKESAHDYRYFPEPDLPSIDLRPGEIDRVRENFPELPAARRQRFEETLGLPHYDADVLTSDYEVADYFEEVVAAGSDAKTASNWVMGEVLRFLKESARPLSEFEQVLPANRLAAMIELIQNGTVSGNLAKQLFRVLLEESGDPGKIARARGLLQESDRDSLLPLVEETLDENPDAVSELLQGKEKAFGFLVGQLMRRTKGKGNPRVIRELLEGSLERRRVETE